MTHIILPGFESSLSFRPATYWEHDNPVSAIISNIKGTYRREKITEILTAEGEKREMNDAFPGISAHPDFYEDDPDDDLPLMLAGIHPAMMGGEFLPKYLRGEVEIARIELQSSTADVYSIRARRATRSSRIKYRIVDEYPEYGPWTVRVKSSALPLTFRNIVKLIDTSRSAFTEDVPEDGNLTDGIRDSVTSQDGDARGAARFLSVESSFYPGLSDYYEKKAELWLRDWLRDNRDEDDKGNDKDEFEDEYDPMAFSRP